MAPLHLETGRLRKIRHVFLTSERILIIYQERTTIAITLSVVRSCRDSPGTLGIDLTQQFQVHLVADGKIVTTVTQVEATVCLITISRHDKTAGVAFCKREESVRNGKRQWNISHDEISRTEDDILAWTYLCPRHRQIEVWMRIVAGRIATMLEKHLTISTTLRQLTGKEALVLLGIDIAYQTFLRLEVKGHCVTLILRTSHFENRSSCQLVSSSIHLTRSMYEVTIQTHVYLFTGQVHILVFHRRIAIKMGQSGSSTISQGVISRIFHRRVDTVLTATIDTV